MSVLDGVDVPADWTWVNGVPQPPLPGRRSSEPPASVPELEPELSRQREVDRQRALKALRREQEENAGGPSSA